MRRAWSTTRGGFDGLLFRVLRRPAALARDSFVLTHKMDTPVDLEATGLQFGEGSVSSLQFSQRQETTPSPWLKKCAVTKPPFPPAAQTIPISNPSLTHPDRPLSPADLLPSFRKEEEGQTVPKVLSSLSHLLDPSSFHPSELQPINPHTHQNRAQPQNAAPAHPHRHPRPALENLPFPLAQLLHA